MPRQARERSRTRGRTATAGIWPLALLASRDVAASAAAAGRRGPSTQLGADPAGPASNLSGHRQRGRLEHGRPAHAARGRALRRRSNPGVTVTVGVAGTGGGFERFCAGETDLSDASRPIKPEEAAACKQGRHRLQRDHDRERRHLGRRQSGEHLGLVPDGRAAEGDLGRRTRRSATGTTSTPPSRQSRCASTAPAPTAARSTSSPTRSTARRTSAAATTPPARTTTSPSRASSGDRGALGYFGLSYAEENAAHLKLLAVDGGNGCVAPSTRRCRTAPTRRSRARSSSTSSTTRRKPPEVAAFLRYLVENAGAIANDGALRAAHAEAARDGAGASSRRERGRSARAAPGARHWQRPAAHPPTARRRRWGEDAIRHGASPAARSSA